MTAAPISRCRRLPLPPLPAFALPEHPPPSREFRFMELMSVNSRGRLLDLKDLNKQLPIATTSPGSPPVMVVRRDCPLLRPPLLPQVLEPVP